MARLLFLGGSDPWMQASGYFLYSARCLEILAEHHDICAASLYRSMPDRLVLPVSINRVWLSERRLDSRVQRLFSLFDLTSFCEREFAYKGVIEWAANVVVREKPDLVIFNHIRAAWLAPRLGRLGVPTLYLAHNAEALAYASIAQLENNPAGKLFAMIEGWKLDRLEKRILDAVGSVITLTEEDRRRLQATRPGMPMHVVPPYFELQASHSVSVVERPILIVGSFHWRPKRTNVRWFLREVYRPLLLSNPGLRCIIVGANADALQDEATQGGQVEIHANVPSVEPYLQTPSIFVTPERQWGGIKLKTCEAAMSGLPIVSTTPGMEGTGLQHGESCLVANSADEMKAALLRYIQDPACAEAFGQRARTVAEIRFSRAEVEKRLLKAINSALGTKEI